MVSPTTSVTIFVTGTEEVGATLSHQHHDPDPVVVRRAVSLPAISPSTWVKWEQPFKIETSLSSAFNKYTYEYICKTMIDLTDIIMVVMKNLLIIKSYISMSSDLENLLQNGWVCWEESQIVENGNWNPQIQIHWKLCHRDCTLRRIQCLKIVSWENWHTIKKIRKTLHNSNFIVPVRKYRYFIMVIMVKLIWYFNFSHFGRMIYRYSDKIIQLHMCVCLKDIQ